MVAQMKRNAGTVVAGTILAVVVYSIVQDQDFGSGITNTVATYIPVLFIVGVMLKALDF